MVVAAKEAGTSVVEMQREPAVETRSASVVEMKLEMVVLAVSDPR